MAKADVWMPLYIGDYLADTRRLTTEQHGAYLLLLMDYWRNGPPPDDDATLAQITNLAPDAWSIAQAKLKHLFSIEDGVWRHKRVDEELVAARENKGKAQAKAKAAADARWHRDQNNAPSNAPSTPQALLEECPSPSPLPKPKPTSKTKAAPPPALPDWLPIESWSGYLEMRKKQKKVPTERAVELVLKALDAMRATGQDVAAVLDKSTAMGWTDVYAIRDERRAPHSNGRPSINSIGVPAGADDNIFDQMRKELPQ